MLADGPLETPPATSRRGAVRFVRGASYAYHHAVKLDPAGELEKAEACLDGRRTNCGGPEPSTAVQCRLTCLVVGHRRRLRSLRRVGFPKAHQDA